MMYSTPFLLRVLGLLWLVLGLLGLLSVSALLKAQLPRSPSVVVSRGLVPLGWSIWPKAFLFAPQAKKILLFAFAKQDPTCLLVVVHCKVVSTLDKRNTKSHLIKLKKVCWPSSTTRGEMISRRPPPSLCDQAISLASNYLYIGGCLEFLWFYWPVCLYFN